ncbi:LytTR family transcriptional regulator DNA-binding domain-containing protein [Spirosoma aerophilum]
MKKNVIDSGETFSLQGDAAYRHLSYGKADTKSQLKEGFMERLPCFIRLSRRVIVNPAYITYIGPSNETFSGGKQIWKVRLTTGKEHFISRRRTKPVIDVLTQIRLFNVQKNPGAARTLVHEES